MARIVRDVTGRTPFASEIVGGSSPRHGFGEGNLTDIEGGRSRIFGVRAWPWPDAVTRFLLNIERASPSDNRSWRRLACIAEGSDVYSLLRRSGHGRVAGLDCPRIVSRRSPLCARMSEGERGAHHKFWKTRGRETRVTGRGMRRPSGCLRVQHLARQPRSRAGAGETLVAHPIGAPS